MNTLITHEGVTIELNMKEPPFAIKGRGWAHLATVVSNSDRDALGKLIGMKLWGEPVIAVESFAIYAQEGRPISLLLKTKKWG